MKQHSFGKLLGQYDEEDVVNTLLIDTDYGTPAKALGSATFMSHACI
jgi:hypothetical protein